MKHAGNRRSAMDACADELKDAEEGAKDADEQALQGEASGKDKYKRIQATSAAAVQSQKASRMQASLLHGRVGAGGRLVMRDKPLADSSAALTPTASEEPLQIILSTGRLHGVTQCSMLPANNL